MIALIPARGGSKGVPRKNIRKLGGKPLIVHTIEQALGAESIEQVIVSTDDDDIAKVSQNAGAIILNRPSELASDTATTESVVFHAMSHYSSEIWCLLQCTSPFRDVGEIDAMYEVMVKDELDSSLTVVQSHSFFWKKVSSRGVPINYDPKDRKRRQDITTGTFIETGATYMFKAEGFKEKNSRLFGNIGLFEVKEENKVEIDSELDLQFCELILREKNNEIY